MKKIITASTLLLFSMQLMAQFPYGNPQASHASDPYNGCENNKKIATEDVVLLTGYDKEMDDNIVWALTKFWKTAKFKTANKDKYTYNKNCSYISVGDFKTTHAGNDIVNSTGNYYSTNFDFSNQKKGASGIAYGFGLPFDNISAKQEKDIVIGADKTMKQMANKALLYTMMLCDVVKEFAVVPPEYLSKQKGESNNECRARYYSYFSPI